MRRVTGTGLSFVVLLAITGVPQADDWSWHRIAWEGTSLASVVCAPISNQTVYMSIRDAGIPVDDRGVYRSTDGGLTWSFLHESANIESDMLSIDPKNPAAIYCGSYYTWGPDVCPKRSLDAGEHWETLEAPLSWIFPSPWTESLLLGTGKNVLSGWLLMRSIDDCETWTTISSHEGPGMSDKIIFHRDDSLLVFAGMYAWGLDPQWGLARSDDAGFTWSIVLEGRRITSFDQDPIDSRHWAAIRADIDLSTAYFAESFDNGDTWDLLELPYDIHYVRDMAFDLHDPQTIYFINPISGYDYLGIYRSTDGGHTLEPMNEGLPEPPGYISIYQFPDRPGEMLAATSDGLWLWTDQQGAAGPGDVGVTRLRLEGVGPCPFRNRVRAWMTLPRNDVVEAQVYLISGALVGTLFEGPAAAGSHLLSWDGRDLSGRETSPGVYVLRVEVGNESAVLRLVKMR